MGKRITQTIYTCDDCGNIPKDGESMWHMERGTTICESCIDIRESGRSECCGAKIIHTDICSECLEHI